MDVFGSSGVRGVVGEELTPRDALQVAQTVGALLDADRVAVGHDTRRTGQLFADAVSSGLASVGCDVDRLGVLPTPALQAHCEWETVAGIMVTASHNPPEFNGLKLVGATGVELTTDVLEQVESRLADPPALVAWDGAGESRHIETARRRYREAVVDGVDSERIAAADLTVALDPGHGAGAITSPDIFTDLGCRVTTVNAQPDGHFPGRDPEPVEQSLGDLRRLVRTSEADIGIAHDGDADRAMFVDEEGTHVEGDAALAALAADTVAAGDTIVSAVNCSQRLVDIATDSGASLELTAIGSTNLITAIRPLQDRGEQVPIAGEGNGGIFFPEYRLARDGAFTAARFLELVADQPVSELLEPYEDYYNLRRNLYYTDDSERASMVDAIAEAAAESDADVDTTDGYRLDYGDGWVLARPSGTEPLIRVYAEARDRERAEELLAWMADRVDAARR